MGLFGTLGEGLVDLGLVGHELVEARAFLGEAVHERLQKLLLRMAPAVPAGLELLRHFVGLRLAHQAVQAVGDVGFGVFLDLLGVASVIIIEILILKYT